jgi:hypothetical protein
VEDNTARFRVTVPAEKVAQLIREGLAAQAAAANPVQSSAVPTPAKQDPPLPPSPAPRKKIVIQGLDNGPREIPFGGH